ncbi:MAG: stability/partitioning determinant [Pelagibacterium sp. SCN 64-44]|nr:MAG: stability/partitioning determinant [Pelagibacterium sp. SCN 64-44]
MSADDKKRATLDFGDLPETSIPAVDPNVVKAATRAAGFRETPRAPGSEPAEPAAVKPRRARRKTGRTQQFATRLKAETLEAIYAYADRHEITLAETIERAMSTLIDGEE